MILLPAIDIREGRAVRLVQGDYGRETAYDADPVDAARRWLDQGAQMLHVVDLDGARSGAPVNVEQVERICATASVPVEVGGGLRRAEDVAAVLGAGASRAVLGTAALTVPALIEELAHDHGDAIAVSADSRGGRVAVEGWERSAEITAAALIADLGGNRGVSQFVFTPVEVDGTLEGPGVEALRDAADAAAGVGAALVYSGGFGSLEDLRELAGLELEALSGVIVGRALYEGRFTVDEGRAALGR